jgi:RNA polymerase sigma factor (TIGR02999 family)
MPEITQLLEDAATKSSAAAAELLPLVYDELRRLAAARMAAEKPGHTLEATGLVHEAYLRLVGHQQFSGRGHFFAAAGEAMRRILVESARRKARLKRGAGGERLALPEDIPAPKTAPFEDILAVHEALDRLAERDPTAAELVKVHYFAGLTLEESADALGLSHRTAYRTWAFARAWLFREVGEPDAAENPTGG